MPHIEKNAPESYRPNKPCQVHTGHRDIVSLPQPSRVVLNKTVF